MPMAFFLFIRPKLEQMCYSTDEMLNSLKSYSNAELVMELAQRGFDINFLTEQMRKRELKISKVISIDAV